ncbi:hypothetical protein RIF29_19040 [Crotalaria pallida]|uniref:Uncharacterized protein n=1 Tax=Crotalaria pallida TaxID=3830 RepID=A0AAN9IB20_CROPI
MITGRPITLAFEWMRQHGVELDSVYPHHEIYSEPTNVTAFQRGSKHAMLIVGCATRYVDGKQKIVLVGAEFPRHEVCKRRILQD